MNNSKNDDRDMSIWIKTATESFCKINIAGTTIKINAFFSMNCMEQYFTFYKQCHDYRLAFCKIAFYMYSKTENINFNISLSENDFLNASDDELSPLLYFIIGEDEFVKIEFDQLSVDNIFEKFYKAYDNLQKKAMVSLEKSMKKTHDIVKHFNFPHLSALQKITDQHNALMKSLETQIEIGTKLHQSMFGLTQISDIFSTCRSSYMNSFSGMAGIINEISLAKTSQMALGLSDAIGAIKNIDFDFIGKMSNLYRVDYSAMLPQLSILDSPLFRTFDNLSKLAFQPLINIDRLEERIRRPYLQTMLEAKWFPYVLNIESIQSKLLYEIMDIAETSKLVDGRLSKSCIHRINKCIKALFTNRLLDNIVCGWSNAGIERHRLKMLRQEVSAYKRKEYAMTTIVLSCMWEGLIADIRSDNGIKGADEKLKDAFRKIIKAMIIQKVILNFIVISFNIHAIQYPI
ncbi:MAG: hypothetical protein PHV32_09720 [Eubacteriales bacterium]|nr:hypothetical protein [Eubacteriales bacterium]